MQHRQITVPKAAAPAEQAPMVSLSKLGWSYLTKRSRAAPPANDAPQQSEQKPLATHVTTISVQTICTQNSPSRQSIPVPGRQLSAYQAALFKRISKPARDPVVEWTRRAFNKHILDFCARINPYLTPQFDSYVQTLGLLRSSAEFGDAFKGDPILHAAARLLDHFFAWSRHSATLRRADHRFTGSQTPTPNSLHPFCLILTGHHGTGKTALVSFLLSHALKWQNWQTHDLSDESVPNLHKCITDIAHSIPQYLDELSIHVLDNAEITHASYDHDFAPLSHLIDSCAKALVKGDNIASRLVIITERLAPWMVDLSKRHAVNIVHIESTYSVPKSVPWARFLRDAEGIPGHAIRMASFFGSAQPTKESNGHDRMTAGYAFILNFVLNTKLDPNWFTMCEQLLDMHRVSLFQMRHHTLALAHTVRESILAIDSQVQGPVETALAYRCLAHARQGPKAGSHPFTEEASWGFLDKIRQAQRARPRNRKCY